MKPVLYAPNATNFNNQGLGALYDCISATVTEERNGMYELRIVYPTSGIHYEDIRPSSIIKALPNEGGKQQLFRVYRIDKPITGKCVIDCEHISYQLNFIPCMPFEANDIQAAFRGFTDNAAEDCPFTFTTSRTTTAKYKQDQPEAIRSRLGGQSGSILDVYGGEYEFDNYEVILHNQRGVVRDTTLRYGKNITDINQEENIEKTITGIMPFWKQTIMEENVESTVLVTLPEKVIHSEASENYPYQRTVTVDFSQDFDEQPTEAQLRQRATEYIESNSIGVPEVSIDVSFIALWGTEEYKSIAPLERVHLCDTVKVVFEPLNISASAKVVKTIFNVLEERYDSVLLGDAKSNFGSTLTAIEKEIEDEIEDLPDESEVTQRVQDIINKVTGSYGGYIVFGYDANGKPQEMYILDTPDIATASSVCRFNKNGIAFSKNGFEGPYSTAWNIDGDFVANYIATGTLASKNKNASINLDNGDSEFKQLSISSPHWLLKRDGSWSLGGDVLNNDGAFNYDPTLDRVWLRKSTDFVLNGIPIAGVDITSQLVKLEDQPPDGNFTEVFCVAIRFPYTVLLTFNALVTEKYTGGSVALYSGLPIPTKQDGTGIVDFFFAGVSYINGAKSRNFNIGTSFENARVYMVGNAAELEEIHVSVTYPCYTGG